MPRSTHRDADLPPPLMTSEPGSFARSTIVERKPQIIKQVIEDNDYPPDVVQALETFKEEIARRPIRPLSEAAPNPIKRGSEAAPNLIKKGSEAAPDVAFWNRELEAHRGKTWLEVPWYFAETYFYRRLLEAVRYFQPGPWEGHDPFGKQKRKQEAMAVEVLTEGWEAIAGIEPEVAFEALLHSCLWGNRADLSNYTVILQAQGGLMAREERRNILIDHTDEVREMVAGGLQRVDFINDNVGLDLLFDLALADFLLTCENGGWVREVVFHLKDRPFFVSDASPKDVQATVSLLQAASDEAVQELGARLQGHLAAKRITLKDDPPSTGSGQAPSTGSGQAPSTGSGQGFWTSSLMFRRLPPPLRADLARSNLVILKGDVNYRRLLSDRHWPHTARLEEIADYFPAPFLVLRTLKGEIMVGLEAGQAEALAAEDPTWLINGKRGIVQLVLGSGWRSTSS